jgi:tripartite-type tricarboxylate transporter receptor subunit TctC
MLGANELVNAKPDGYTLSQLPHGVFRIPHMQKVQFDTLKDFTWIACLTGYTFGLVVPADSPIKSIKDLVDYAKANPGKFTYGSTGTGTSPHLAVEEFAQRAGIKLTHVPFKGNADNMQAILGGHIMAASDATGWGAARGRRQAAPAGHLRQQAHQALAQRADARRTGLQDGERLALRRLRPQGHGPGLS